MSKSLKNLFSWRNQSLTKPALAGVVGSATIPGGYAGGAVALDVGVVGPAAVGGTLFELVWALPASPGARMATRVAIEIKKRAASSRGSHLMRHPAAERRR